MTVLAGILPTFLTGVWVNSLPHATNTPSIRREILTLPMTRLAWNRETGGAHNQLPASIFEQVDRWIFLLSDGQTPYVDFYAVGYGHDDAPPEAMNYKGVYLMYFYGSTYWTDASYTDRKHPHTSLGQWSTDKQNRRDILKILESEMKGG